MANETRGVSAVHGIDACDAEEIGERLGSAIALADLMRCAYTKFAEFRAGTVSRVGGMLLDILDGANGVLRGEGAAQ